MTGRGISVTNTWEESKSCHPLSTGVKGARVAPGSGPCQAAEPPLALSLPETTQHFLGGFVFLQKWPRAVILCAMIPTENTIDLSKPFISRARRVSHGCGSGSPTRGQATARPHAGTCSAALGIVAKGPKSKVPGGLQTGVFPGQAPAVLAEAQIQFLWPFLRLLHLQVQLSGSQAQLRPQEQPWGLWSAPPCEGL